jgi:glycosyltransferase involved in cell wall biosynthesis
MNRRHILLTIRQGKIGGGERHVLDICQYIDKSKFKISVLSFTDGPLIESLNKLKIPNTVIHTTKPFDYNVWPKVRSFIEKINPNMVHAHGTRAFSNSFKPAKKTKIPVLYTIHGWSFHPDQSILVNLMRKITEKFLCNNAKLNIFVSKADHNSAKKLGIKNGIVIPNGINTGHLVSQHRNLKSNYKNKFLVGFVGRLTKQKNPFHFLQAAAACHGDNDIHFLMIGDGELMNQSVQFIEKNNLKNVSLLGFRQDIYDILFDLDIFCLPSLWEGLPIGLLEAMIMQKAIIATKIPGNQELIKDEENGILIDINDVGGLVRQIKYLKSNEDFKNKIAQKAYEDAKMKYDVQDMVKKLEIVYQKIDFNNN